MFPSTVLWIVRPRAPSSTASRTYTIRTEEPRAQQLACFRSKENRLVDNKDCSCSCLLCQLGISDLGVGVSLNSILFQDSDAHPGACPTNGRPLPSSRFSQARLYPLVFPLGI